MQGLGLQYAVLAPLIDPPLAGVVYVSKVDVVPSGP
jgi:hypothetical protein